MATNLKVLDFENNLLSGAVPSECDAPDDGSVWEGGDCEVRVARGGAFRSPATSMRSENREKFKSNKGQYNVGIRIARDL